MKNIDINKCIRAIVYMTISFMIICGAIMTFWELRPPFLDEWFIIRVIKYKSTAEVWGAFYDSQFPRIYLQIIKKFAETLDFSYLSLRLPSFIVHTCGILYCFYLSGQLFKKSILHRYLWAALYIAYPTSVFYFVLTKHYTMEMFISLVAIGQFVMLINIAKGNKVSHTKYILLCVSMFLAPLFSYTYPIIMLPVFIILFVSQLSERKNLYKQLLPMTLCCAGIVALYFIDIRQVLTDPNMKRGFQDEFMHGFSFTRLLESIYSCFAIYGRGVFQHAIALTGISAWLLGTYKFGSILRKKDKSIPEWLVLHAVALTWISIGLFIAGLIPLHLHRLNAYKVPATASLIIYLIEKIKGEIQRVKIASIVAGTLLGLQILFIVQPLIRELTEAPHHRKVRIYNNGKTAIALAQQDNIPVFTTSMTLYPHEDIDQADWVIKCYPLYPKEGGVPVYAIDNEEDSDSLLHTLPYSSAVVTTGDSVFVISR